MPLESNHCRSVEHHQPSYCCRAPDHRVLSSGSKEVLPLRPSVVPNSVATLSYWDDDAITALRRTYHAPHLLKYTSTLCLSPNPRRMPYAEPCCCTIAPKSRSQKALNAAPRTELRIRLGRRTAHSRRVRGDDSGSGGDNGTGRSRVVGSSGDEGGGAGRRRRKQRQRSHPQPPNPSPLPCPLLH